MRVEVIGRNLEVTTAIRAHAEAKAEKLHRHFNGIQMLTFRLAREDHKHHGLFGVELVIDVVKRTDLVCHARGEDLYALIDQVVQTGSRQLTEFKEKLREGKRSPARPPQDPP